MQYVHRKKKVYKRIAKLRSLEIDKKKKYMFPKHNNFFKLFKHYLTIIVI